MKNLSLILIMIISSCCKEDGRIYSENDITIVPYHLTELNCLQKDYVGHTIINRKNFLVSKFTDQFKNLSSFGSFDVKYKIVGSDSCQNMLGLKVEFPVIEMIEMVKL